VAPPQLLEKCRVTAYKFVKIPVLPAALGHKNLTVLFIQLCIQNSKANRTKALRKTG